MPRLAYDINYYDECELCDDTDDLVMCEGLIVCSTCAKTYAGLLAQYHDDMMDDLRGS